jgi:hypothetical protein
MPSSRKTCGKMYRGNQPATIWVCSRFSST